MTPYSHHSAMHLFPSLLRYFKPLWNVSIPLAVTGHAWWWGGRWVKERCGGCCFKAWLMHLAASVCLGMDCEVTGCLRHQNYVKPYRQQEWEQSSSSGFRGRSDKDYMEKGHFGSGLICHGPQLFLWILYNWMTHEKKPCECSFRVLLKKISLLMFWFTSR